MSSKDIAISVRNLSKSYTIAHNNTKHTTLGEAFMHRLKRPLEKTDTETFWALRDVSFDVQKGEVVGVIGRNGAGKSTLLKILSQITEPTAGEIHLYGRVGSLLEVGTGFHPELTGRENIFLNGAILGMRRREIESQFDAIVDFAEVEHFLDTPVKRYSSGMYVRLAFAVAAHLDTEILIVDEVLAVGDAGFQKKCMGKMGEVAGRGRTVLLVTHNMGVVRSLCTRAILLRNGQVETDSSIDTVITQYMSNASLEQSPLIDLPQETPTAISPAPGRATRLRLEAMDGTPRTQFRMFEPWHIVLEFEMHEAAKEVIAAIGVLTMEGVPIVTSWSESADLKAGKYYSHFHFNLPLSSQIVQFVIGLSSREQAFYYASGIGKLSISEASAHDQPLRSSNSGLLVASDRPPIHPYCETVLKVNEENSHLFPCTDNLPYEKSSMKKSQHQ